MKNTAHDLTGQKFGRWRVLERAGSTKKWNSLWRCQCDCGEIKTVVGYSLKDGGSQSCGCLSREKAKVLNRTHGRYDTETYKSWIHMRRRCNNRNSTQFKYYGGRGIKICDRWNHYEHFLADMGEKPEGLTIERTDNNGDYCPKNCRWATREDQMMNRRNTLFITYRDKTKTLKEWSEDLKIKYSILWKRLYAHGMPIEKAFTMSIKKRRNAMGGGI